MARRCSVRLRSISNNFSPTFTIIVNGGGHDVAGVARRADSGAWNRQRHLGDHLRGHRVGSANVDQPGTDSAQLGGAEQIIGIIAFLIIGLFNIIGIVLVQEGQRRIPVQYAKRVRGNRVYGGQSSHIPLKVNMSGMIPLIFAQSIIIFPGTIASYGCPEQVAPPGAGIFKQVACFTYQTFSPQYGTGTVVYSTLLFLLVVGFTYFYTMVIFNQQNIPDPLQRNGGFIPGIRPGKRTEEYLQQGRLSDHIGRGVFLGLVAILPFITQQITGADRPERDSALIVVGVAVDTMRQLEAQLVMRNYEGFINR